MTATVAPFELEKLSLPKHVAIIPDGNRRFAQKKTKNATFGHTAGSQALIDIVKTASDLGIGYLTFYLFSTENWHRPQWEITSLMMLLDNFLKKKTPDLIANDVSLHTIGSLEKFPVYVQKRVGSSKKATANGKGLKLIFALNYGGRDELCRAMRNLGNDLLSGALKPDQIVEEKIAQYLDTARWPEPDLLIRTSGEMRISNFLLWQISYSELYFTEELWPDFTPEKFKLALRSYGERQRRIGS